MEFLFQNVMSKKGNIVLDPLWMQKSAYLMDTAIYHYINHDSEVGKSCLVPSVVGQYEKGSDFQVGVLSGLVTSVPLPEIASLKKELTSKSLETMQISLWRKEPFGLLKDIKMDARKIHHAQVYAYSITTLFATWASCFNPEYTYK